MNESRRCERAMVIVAALLIAASARADWNVRILGPQGSASFGDRPFVEYADVQEVPSYQDVLSPYGDWVALPSYGEVWIPSVDASWRPYMYGQWVYSSYGWTWVSYEPWGYIPHHFGEWHYADGYGWAWRPGYDWYPARVSWYYGGDYMAWYPAGAFVDVNIDIMPMINVVSVRDFTSPNLQQVMVAPGRIQVSAVAQAIREPRSFRDAAPEKTYVEQHAKRPVQAIEFDERQVKVGGHSMKVVAPKGEVRQHVIQQAQTVAPRVVKSGPGAKGKAPAAPPAEGKGAAVPRPERAPHEAAVPPQGAPVREGPPPGQKQDPQAPPKAPPQRDPKMAPPGRAEPKGQPSTATPRDKRTPEDKGKGPSTPDNAKPQGHAPEEPASKDGAAPQGKGQPPEKNKGKGKPEPQNQGQDKAPTEGK